jgi:hypothetical protein
VARLHSAKFDDWLRLDSNQSNAINSALPWHLMWQPIYSWQDERACTDDEWTNRLRVADTRRFAHFVMDAYRRNWPAAPMAERSGARESRRFREFSDCVIVAKSLSRKLATLRRPCVYRVWE